MKTQLELTPCESETLFLMSLNHPWRNVRIRAASLHLLGQGVHYTTVAQQCGISIPSIYNWLYAWEALGIIGLFGGHNGGRTPLLDETWVHSLTTIASNEALTLKQIAQKATEQHGQPMPSALKTVARTLRVNGFSFKRTRTSLKKKR